MIKSKFVYFGANLFYFHIVWVRVYLINEYNHCNVTFSGIIPVRTRIPVETFYIALKK